MPAYVNTPLMNKVSATKTDIQTVTATPGTPADVTGLSVSITPFSTASKIRVRAVVYAGNDASNGVFAYLVRNSTIICIGDAASSRVQVSGDSYQGGTANLSVITIEFDDSPSSASATTYKIQASVPGGGGNAYINRSKDDTNSDTYPRLASTISAEEILV